MLLLLPPLSSLHCHCTIQTPPTPQTRDNCPHCAPPPSPPPPPLREQNPKTEASNTHPDLIPQQKPSDIPPEQMCTEEQRGFLPPFVWEPFRGVSCSVCISRLVLLLLLASSFFFLLLLLKQVDDKNINLCEAHCVAHCTL